MHFNVYQVDLDINAHGVNVVLTDDLVEYKWFDINELAGIKLTPPSVKLFAELKLI